MRSNCGIKLEELEIEGESFSKQMCLALETSVIMRLVARM